MIYTSSKILFCLCSWPNLQLLGGPTFLLTDSLFLPTGIKRAPRKEHFGVQSWLLPGQNLNVFPWSLYILKTREKLRATIAICRGKIKHSNVPFVVESLLTTQERSLFITRTITWSLFQWLTAIQVPFATLSAHCKGDKSRDILKSLFITYKVVKILKWRLNLLKDLKS